MDELIEFRDEDWRDFWIAADELRSHLGMSRGAAQAKLRSLCAMEDADNAVRSIRCLRLVNSDREFADEPELIKPSEWAAGQPDLADDPAGGDFWCIWVSEEDFRHWLTTQSAPAPEIEPQAPRRQAAGKRPLVKDLLARLHPNGVPDPARCNRKMLRRELLKIDPTLRPLDEGTLKTAIDEYNATRNDPT
jgi:hypothetical protein